MRSAAEIPRTVQPQAGSNRLGRVYSFGLLAWRSYFNDALLFEGRAGSATLSLLMPPDLSRLADRERTVDWYSRGGQMELRPARRYPS